MTKFTPWTMAVCSLALFAACGPKERPLVPLDEVCSVSEHMRAVRTSGYLLGPGNSMICDGETCEMVLSNVRAGGNTTIRVDLRTGTGNNKMLEPPDDYQDADLVFVDNEGNTHRVGEWVTVQGIILNERGCMITPVERIFPAQEPPAGAAAPNEGSEAAAPADGSAAAPAAPSAAGSAAAAPTDPAPAAVPAATPEAAPATAEGDKPGEVAPAGGKP